MKLSLSFHLSFAIMATAADVQKPLSATSPNHQAQTPFTTDFNNYVSHVMEQWNVPGMSIAVIDRKQVFSKGFGFASFPDTRATPESLYFAGSTTKAQLGAVIAHLIDSKAYPELAQGWKTPISSIIPDDFVLQDEWATHHLTLEDAVSHRTGMTRHDASWHKEINGTRSTLKDVVRNLRNLPPPNVEPRTEWHYCNLMFVTLSHVVETLIKKSMADVFKEIIWDPLGMDATFLEVQDAEQSPYDLAQSYKWDEEKKQFELMPSFAAYAASGAGGVITNVVDYAEWIKCMLYETQPFSKATHKDIRTPRTIANAWPSETADVTLYGLAWARKMMHGHVVYEHGGSTFTYGAQVHWFPDLEFGIVALANADDTSNDAEAEIVQRLIEDRLQVPPDARVDVGKGSRKFREHAKELLQNARDILYPKRPPQKVPSSVTPSQLEGIYHNKGFGTMKLVQQTHPSDSKETILVADREELVFPHQMRFHHVSGDDWIVYLVFAGGLETQTQFHKATVLLKSDGSVDGIQVEYYDRIGDEMLDALVLYSKAE